MIEIATAAALGLGLGAATGIPLGVVNVSVVEAATRASRRHATGIGTGGALADSIHAGLAFLGIAPQLAAHRDAFRILAAVSAAAVIVYAVIVFRGRAAHARDRGRDGGFARGVAIGLGLTLPNPAPLAAWIAVAAALLPGASVAAGVAAAIGVGLGSAAWFALLARLATRLSSSSLFTRWLPRVVAVALAAIAVVAVLRAFG